MVPHKLLFSPFVCVTLCFFFISSSCSIPTCLVGLNGTDVEGCGVTPDVPCASIIYCMTELSQNVNSSGFYQIALYAGIYTGEANCGVTVDNATLVIGTVTGQQDVIIDCQHAEFHFNISRYDYGSVIRFLHLKNGNSSDHGGCVHSQSVITFESVIFEGCISSGIGGAVYINTTLLDSISGIKNSLFINNQAAQGGAFGMSASILIMSSHFVGNNATEGGAIWYIGQLAVYNTTFDSNRALATGGAVHAEYNFGTSSIRYSLITNNVAANGGGLYVKEIEYSLSLNYTVVTLNEALSYGGGVYLWSSYLVQIAHSTITKNIAQAAGGAYLNVGETFLPGNWERVVWPGTTIADNVALDAEFPGGVLIDTSGNNVSISVNFALAGVRIVNHTLNVACADAPASEHLFYCVALKNNTCVAPSCGACPGTCFEEHNDTTLYCADGRFPVCNHGQCTFPNTVANPNSPSNPPCKCDSKWKGTLCAEEDKSSFHWYYWLIIGLGGALVVIVVVVIIVATRRKKYQAIA